MRGDKIGTGVCALAEGMTATGRELDARTLVVPPLPVLTTGRRHCAGDQHNKAANQRGSAQADRPLLFVLVLDRNAVLAGARRGDGTGGFGLTTLSGAVAAELSSSLASRLARISSRLT